MAQTADIVTVFAHDLVTETKLDARLGTSKRGNSLIDHSIRVWLRLDGILLSRVKFKLKISLRAACWLCSNSTTKYKGGL